MDNQKENKVARVTVPPMHTFMVSEEDRASSDELQLSLLSGEAEVMGMQLKKHYPLKFRMPCIVLIFSWHGCEVEMQWPQEKNSKSREDWLDVTLNNHLPESPMVKYLALHYELSVLRKLAQEQTKLGPRVAILGTASSGVPYSSRLMLTWAGKLNAEPILVDLDLDNGLFLDGTVGAASYKYRVCTGEDILEKCQKICMVYGNRKLHRESFLELAKLLATHVQNRLAREMEEVKWKGLQNEMSNFASGVILQCPRVSEEKKVVKQMLPELLAIFQITHVLVVDNPDLSNFISRNCPGVEKLVAPRLEGVQNLARLPKVTKIMRYFGEEPTREEKMPFGEVTLYEIIQEDFRPPYVRVVDIRTELVNKTAVVILQAPHSSPGEDPQLIAERILRSVAILAVRIARIGEEEVTFDVPPVDNFARFKEKLWVSMIAEKSSP